MNLSLHSKMQLRRIVKEAVQESTSRVREQNENDPFFTRTTVELQRILATLKDLSQKLLDHGADEDSNALNTAIEAIEGMNVLS